MTTHNSTEKTRLASLKLLRLGVASPSEVSALAGVSRQLIRHWVVAADLNWRKARAAALAKAWQKVLRRS
jgi:hypothetical protein